MTLAFSEAPTLEWQAPADTGIEITGGTLDTIARVTEGGDRAWTLTVTPTGDEEIDLALAATTDCKAEGAICTSDGRGLSEPIAVAIARGPDPTITATFGDLPEEGHGGENFTIGLTFSEDFGVSYKSLEYPRIDTVGGWLTKAKRVTKGDNTQWTLTLRPKGARDVTVTLFGTEDCAEEKALCNDDGVAVAETVTVDIPETPAPETVGQTLWSSTLTVGERDFFGFIGSDFGGSLSSTEWSEDGTNHSVGAVNIALFSEHSERESALWIDFSPAPPDLETLTLHVDGASHVLSEAVVAGTQFQWPVGELTWTEDQRVFLRLVRTVELPAPELGVSVYDAEVREGPDATLVFPVVLEPAPTTEVTVNYATSDGTATEGLDYEETSSTLTFDPGETEKTIVVPVIDDSYDEGMETLTITLSEPTETQIAKGTAQGRIVNSDHMPKAWLARFGRTVAEQVIDAVDGRLFTAPTPGTQMTLGGYVLLSAPG